MQKHRIYTNIGRDQKINVEINQDFDIMEILSLKFTQKDIFSAGKCSDYGVVVGRVSANRGYGVPNVRVSIFIPQEDMDEDDPVISALYPYKGIYDRNDDNYRYNLLPSRQQHPGHSPTGTFFDQQDILTREEVLEVFEKYYSFTVKTNEAGDFMIWGVPVGTQILHVDIDLSDIGCFSLRPNDFLNKGYGLDQFESYYKFKSSSDINSLPQIVTFDKTIEVYPFWGNEELCEIGITRSDFDLSERDIEIEPVSIILFSSVTDESSHAVKRKGKIRINSGYKCNLQTSEGKIEVVRYTGKSVFGADGITEYPELEYFNPTETINEDGVAMIAFPMNLDYVYTNELGEQEITNDPNKGIPTGAIARFRFSLDFQSNKVATAKYLVPNIREFTHSNTGQAAGFNDKSDYEEGLLATYTFSDVFEDYITVTPPITGVTIYHHNYGDDTKEHKKNLILANGTINGTTAPQDYFYRFVYSKVYAVSSFQGTHYETQWRDSFLGIKEIRPNVESDCASSTNYLPTNFAFKNRIKFNVIISQVLLFLQYLFSIVTIKFAEILGKTAFNIGRALQGIRILAKIGQRVEDFAYRTQDRYTKELPLTIYPDCEECTSDSESLTNEGVTFENACRRAEAVLHIDITDHPVIGMYIHNSEQSTRFSNSSAPSSTFLDELFPGDSAAQNDGGCSGATEVTFTMLNSLHTQTLADGTPRYGVEFYCSGNTLSFDSFADYLQNPSDERGIYFIYSSNIQGFPGYAIGFSYNQWLELTGINLRIEENREVLAESTPVIRIFDRSVSPDYITTPSGSTMGIEVGCEKYDKLYDESITFAYWWCTGSTDNYVSILPKDPIYGYPPPDDPGNGQWTETDPLRPSTHSYLIATIAGETSTMRMPLEYNFRNNYFLGLIKIRGIGLKKYDRKTKSGLTEFRDGLFTIIPVINGPTNNLKVLREWYRRKRVGLSFCGGVVNYSFIDNWLHGMLYFFKFDKRIRWDTEANYDLNQRGSKYPRELVFYNIFDKNFYYRCTPYKYVNGVGTFTGQTYEGNLELLHPTTFYDLGIRDEFLGEICTDIRTDSTCSVVRDITHTSYQDPANVVEYAINYRLDTTKSKFDVDDFFSKRHLGSNIKVFDGDITQLMSINCEAGIEAFDLDVPHYTMYNGELMDPEDNYFEDYFKSGDLYGPTPIDFKLDNDGAYMRLCLNSRLGDYCQVVPFYLWEKFGTGFGQYGNRSDDQKWDKTQIASMPIQRMFSVSGVTETSIYDPTYQRYGRTNYLMPDGEEEYIIKPMTVNHRTFSATGDTQDMLERFEIITYGTSAPVGYPDAIDFVEGDLWLQVLTYDISLGDEGYRKDPWTGWIHVVVNKVWERQPDLYISGTAVGEPFAREMFVPQTVLNYWGEADNAKQVLSTPFLFYFGLKPGRTALDLLIKYYGPKDVFTAEEDIFCVSDQGGTSGTAGTAGTAGTSGTSGTSGTGGTSGPEPVWYFHLNRCIEEYPASSNYYAKSLTGSYLSSGDGVYGAINCDPNYKYVVVGSTQNESIYINAGYQDIDRVSLDASHPGCQDCNGDLISPPPGPPLYTTVTLVRKDNSGDAMCGLAVYNGDDIHIVYMEYVENVIPQTIYTVYTDTNFTIPFEPGGLKWGIIYDNLNYVVEWTVFVGSNGPGIVSDWTQCPESGGNISLTVQGQSFSYDQGAYYNVVRNEPTDLSFLYNYLYSTSSVNYILNAGDESELSTNNNLDNALIQGNRFEWAGVQDGTVITHGVFCGFNINQTIKWNFVQNCPYGIIFKSGGGPSPNMNITANGASYNIVRGGRFAGRSKGINGARFYNNTFYGDGANWYRLLINANTDGVPSGYPGNPSINTKVKNNIFYTTTKTPSIKIDTGSRTGFECDYNLYWCEVGDHEPIFIVDETSYTWTQWRALGYDAHSVIANPSFNNVVIGSGFAPASKATIQFGTTIVGDYNWGLQRGADWVVGQNPSIVVQSGTWQVGAKIFP